MLGIRFGGRVFGLDGSISYINSLSYFFPLNYFEQNI